MRDSKGLSTRRDREEKSGIDDRDVLQDLRQCSLLVCEKTVDLEYLPVSSLLSITNGKLGKSSRHLLTK